MCRSVFANTSSMYAFTAARLSSAVRRGPTTDSDRSDSGLSSLAGCPLELSTLAAVALVDVSGVTARADGLRLVVNCSAGVSACLDTNAVGNGSDDGVEAVVADA